MKKEITKEELEGLKICKTCKNLRKIVRMDQMFCVGMRIRCKTAPGALIHADDVKNCKLYKKDNLHNLKPWKRVIRKKP